MLLHVMCGAQVTIISRGRPVDLPERHGTCTFHHVDGSTTTSDSYAAADLATADAVIIGAPAPHTLTLLCILS